MAYKQEQGRMNMPKTGRGLSPSLLVEDPKEPKPIKKYGKVTVKKEKKDGVTTVTATRPYSTGGSKGKDLGPDFKPTKAQTERANKRRKGEETKSFTTVDRKLKGVKVIPTKSPKPKIDSSIKPTKPSNVTVVTSIQGRKKKMPKITKSKTKLRSRVSRGGSFKPGCLTD
jgi:hypothetical protein